MFHPIEDDKIAIDSWIRLNKNNHFVIVEPFDFKSSSSATGQQRAAQAAAAVMLALVRAAEAQAMEAQAMPAAWSRTAPAARAVVSSWKQYNLTLTKAQSEQEKSGLIKGVKALLVGESVLVWISHYDLEELEKRQ